MMELSLRLAQIQWIPLLGGIGVAVVVWTVLSRVRKAPESDSSSLLQLEKTGTSHRVVLTVGPEVSIENPSQDELAASLQGLATAPGVAFSLGYPNGWVHGHSLPEGLFFCQILDGESGEVLDCAHPLEPSVLLALLGAACLDDFSWVASLDWLPSGHGLDPEELEVSLGAHGPADARKLFEALHHAGIEADLEQNACGGFEVTVSGVHEVQAAEISRSILRMSV